MLSQPWFIHFLLRRAAGKRGKRKKNLFWLNFEGCIYVEIDILIQQNLESSHPPDTNKSLLYQDLDCIITPKHPNIEVINTYITFSISHTAITQVID